MSLRAQNTRATFSSLMALISDVHQNIKWPSWSKQASSGFGAFLEMTYRIRPAFMALYSDVWIMQTPYLKIVLGLQFTLKRLPEANSLLLCCVLKYGRIKQKPIRVKCYITAPASVPTSVKNDKCKTNAARASDTASEPKHPEPQFGLRGGGAMLLNIQLQGPEYREALTTPGEEESLIIHWGIRRVSICWTSAAIRQLLDKPASLVCAEKCSLF